MKRESNLYGESRLAYYYLLIDDNFCAEDGGTFLQFEDVRLRG